MNNNIDAELSDEEGSPSAVGVEFTKEELEAAVVEAYSEAGLTKTLRNGRTVKDDDAMRDRTYQQITSRVASTRAEMSMNSLTAGELYSRVFPGAPGSEPGQLIADLSPLQRKVRESLQRACWNLTNPNRKGSIQSRLGKEGRSEVLIRTKVQRGVDEIVGVFLTNDGKLILEESVDPVIEKLLSAARELRLHNDVVIEPRHQELAQSIARRLETAKRRVSAELTRGPGNGAQAALPAAEAVGTE